LCLYQISAIVLIFRPGLTNLTASHTLTALCIY
jgi:hypothetical protein